MIELPRFLRALSAPPAQAAIPAQANRLPAASMGRDRLDLGGPTGSG